MSFGMIAAAAITTVGGAMLADDNGAEGANDAAADASHQQAKIAQANWDRYLKVYAPLEDQFVEESKNLGSQANQAEAAKRTAADVATSFAGVRERLNRTPGANPSSQAYLQEQNRINLAEAAASATGQTGARERAVEKGMAAQTTAMNLGKGLPGDASSAFGSAASSLASQGQNAQRRSDSQAAGFGRAVGGVFQSKGMQDWLNSSSAATPGVVNTVTGADMDVFYGA